MPLPTQEIDYLIIGQGLAGSLLAWELKQRGQKIIIVDNAKENASQVAAGLINPVTGMRFVKSVGVDQLLPFAINTYKNLSHHFQQSFYFEKPMLRLLRNEKELTACKKRLHQADYLDYLDDIIPSPSNIISPFGLLRQKKTAYLSTIPLLTALKNHFISINAYIKAEINYADIKIQPQVHWNNIRAKKIIFCEGYLATKNPWFSYLPFQPVKGEIITASSTISIQQNILNYGHWFIPLDNHQFRTGSTFDRSSLDTHTSVDSKQTILSSLKHIYPALGTPKIIDQKAGIRPTTLDKHPFIGHHPEHQNLVIFNGFGAKGSLQIPWFSQCLADNLLNNHPVPQTSDILRYN